MAGRSFIKIAILLNIFLVGGTFGSSFRSRGLDKLYRLPGGRQRHNNPPWRLKRQASYGYTESKPPDQYGHQPVKQPGTEDDYVSDANVAENQYDDYYGNDAYQGRPGNGGDFYGGNQDYVANYHQADNAVVPPAGNAGNVKSIGGNYGPKNMWDYFPGNDYNYYGGGFGHVPTNNPFRDSEFVPLGAGEAIGPDVVKDEFDRNYGNFFSDFDDKIAFKLPTLSDNCWLQAMLAVEWGFSPNCKVDGSYGPKQCAKKRCWCTNSGGEKVRRKGGKNNDGFYYGIDGLLLRCDEN